MIDKPVSLSIHFFLKMIFKDESISIELTLNNNVSETKGSVRTF